MKRIHIKTRTLKILGGIFLLLMGGSLFLLSDYFHIASNQYQLQKATEEKEDLKKQFYALEAKLNDLYKEFFQLRDFNKKIRTITSLSHTNHLKKQYGKISSDPNLLALSAPSFPERDLASLSPDIQEQKIPTVPSSAKEPVSYTELIIQIEDLNKKTKLVKQNTWDLYSHLLKKREILSNTPSILPVKGWISSPFGYRNETFYADHDLRFHRGLDIAADIKSPVFASASGQVTRAGYDVTGYGWHVIIDHGYSVKTFYAHMLEEPKVKKGEYVKRGQIIGKVGNTGKSTGPHLHYEIHISGVPVNPINYILNEDISTASTGLNDTFSVY